MDDQQFRASLRHALDDSAAPPSMSPADALRAGRRAARRRTLAGGAVGAAGLAALTAVGVAAASAGAGAPQPVGASGTPTINPPVPGNASASPLPAGSETKPVSPTGPNGSPQEDHTARAGVKADAAKALRAHLTTLVPAGYTISPDSKVSDEQAQFENKVGDRDAWSYLASIEIRKDGAAGRLIVQVYEPGLRTGATPCDIASGFWTKPSGCGVVPSGGQAVAVASGGVNDLPDQRVGQRIDKWSAYAYPDGTVVYVAESKRSYFGPPASSGPQLAALPFDDAQLAALALDPAFHVAAS
ncbi:hypothetical protein [Dactylosporangium sp. NPDC048998]|uniref:hypothetical protein n=1 Tax=Dactylosporangium sp. NPDC048998 TaxID=3363976 RepID=UPI003721049D